MNMASNDMTIRDSRGIGTVFLRVRHVCPMVTGLVQQGGGPILPPGCPIVLINFFPAGARATDVAVCVGPPDLLAQGSSSVMVGQLPTERSGGIKAHGTAIVAGSPTVIIGGQAN